MPRHDPTPPGYERRLRAWKRYKQMMSWMVILAIVAVLLALIYLKRGGNHVPPAMIIATIAGVGLSVLLGTGLMGLVFMSNISGIDDEADRGDDFDDRR